MDPERSRKLAHLSYVAPLVALLVHAQLSETLVGGGYSAKLAMTLLAALLIGGFAVATFVFGQAAGDPRQRVPALLGIVSNLVAAALITFWLTTG